MLKKCDIPSSKQNTKNQGRNPVGEPGGLSQHGAGVPVAGVAGAGITRARPEPSWGPGSLMPWCVSGRSCLQVSDP